MPIDYTKYPKKWRTEIRPAILERANNRCEQCSALNHSIGYRDEKGVFYSSEHIHECLERKGIDLFDNVLSNCFDKKGNPTNPIKIVLTVAHLDHNIQNNDPANLKALCQRCHIRHDINHHKTNARKTIDRNKGLQNLF